MSAWYRISRVYHFHAVVASGSDIESQTVVFTGKDQYSQDIPVTVMRVESRARPNGISQTDAEALIVCSDNKVTLSGAGNDRQPAGTYTYRVWVSDKISTIISAAVKKPSQTDVTKASSYRVVPVSGSNDLTIDPSKIADSERYQSTVRGERCKQIYRSGYR